MNEKAPRNQVLEKRSYRRNKHLGSASWYVFKTILKTHKRVILTNGLENKKVDDNEHCLSHRQYVSRKGGKRTH